MLGLYNIEILDSSVIIKILRGYITIVTINAIAHLFRLIFDIDGLSKEAIKTYQNNKRLFRLFISIYL